MKSPASRPTSRADRKARTRAALIDAAIDEAIHHGVEGARVERIAAAAGCTTGALYTHFRSKDELYLVVYDEATRRVSAETNRLAERLDRPGTDRPGSDRDPSPDVTSPDGDEAEGAAEGCGAAPSTAPGTRPRALDPGDRPLTLAEAAQVWLAWHRADLRWFRLNAQFLLTLGDHPTIRGGIVERRRAARAWFARALEHVTAEQGRRLTIPVDELVDLVHALGLGLLLELTADPRSPAAARFGAAAEALVAAFTEELP